MIAEINHSWTDFLNTLFHQPAHEIISPTEYCLRYNKCSVYFTVLNFYTRNKLDLHRPCCRKKYLCSNTDIQSFPGDLYKFNQSENVSVPMKIHWSLTFRFNFAFKIDKTSFFKTRHLYRTINRTQIKLLCTMIMMNIPLIEWNMCLNWINVGFIWKIELNIELIH